MIARIIPGSLDVEGKAVSQPRKKHYFRPTFPLQAYLTQPLEHRCFNLVQIRDFLSTCRYVSDEKQHDVRDYWAPPEEFERTRRGDCDCAALWAWRQLIEIGYEARFVLGSAGNMQTGHAWLILKQNSDWYILEPFCAWWGATFPRIYTLRYQPRASAAWDGETLRYFEHAEVDYRPGFGDLIGLLSESTIYLARIHSRRARSRFNRLRYHLRIRGRGTMSKNSIVPPACGVQFLVRPSSPPVAPIDSGPNRR